MEVIIKNAEEAELPLEMIENLKKLLQLRIEELPKEGTEIDILYSEKDPLMDKGLWDTDNEAYNIYFSIIHVVPSNEENLDKISITVELNF